MDSYSLSQLIRPASTASFLNHTWGRRAALYAQSLAAETDELLTLESLELMLATLNRAPEGWLYLARGGRSPVPPEMVDAQGMLDLPKLRAAFASGATLYLTKAQRLSPSLMRLSRALEVDLGAMGVHLREAVNAHVFLTPPNAQGFQLHRDEHASFVLQLDGAKEWIVYGSPGDETAHGGQTFRPGAVDVESLRDLDRSTFHLRKGDVLYLPEWWPHEAKTSRDHSLHATIRMFPLRWVDLMLDVCANHPALAAPVPRAVAREPDAAPQVLGDILQSPVFAQTLAPLLQAAIRRRAIPTTALPADGLRQVLELDQIDLETRLIRPQANPCEVFETDGQACISFPGGLIRGPAPFRDVFDFVAGATELRPGDLPALTGANYDRLNVVRAMVRDGLLRTCDDGR